MTPEALARRRQRTLTHWIALGSAVEGILPGKLLDDAREACLDMSCKTFKAYFGDLSWAVSLPGRSKTVFKQHIGLIAAAKYLHWVGREGNMMF